MKSALRSVVFGLLALGCATAPTPGPATADFSSAPALNVPDLEERALLLLLADRQIYEPYTAEQSLVGEPGLRAEAAKVLGWIDDDRARRMLGALMQDDSPAVRRAAVFAMGLHGERADRVALTVAAGDPDSETGRRAVEGLARSGAALATALEALDGLPVDERDRRLLPTLFRFADDGVVTLARAGLESPEEALRGAAAYALCREPRSEGLPTIRELTADPDSWVRGLAARALGRVGTPADLPRLRGLLADPAAGPVIQALRSAARLLESGDAAPPDDWRPELIRLLADPRPGVVAATLEVASHWLLDEELARELLAVLDAGGIREQELALLALAEGGDPRAADRVRAAAASPEPVLRSAAAASAAWLGLDDVVIESAHDDSPRVRVAVLSSGLERDDPETAEVRVRLALGDVDSVVRAVALGWLAEHPVLPMDILARALQASWEEPQDDARLAAIEALAARGEAEPGERGAVVEALYELTQHSDYLLRRQVGAALERLGEASPPLGAATDRLPVEGYREIVLRTRQPRRVDMATERGVVELELDCPAAPLTCLNFLTLASQGFYDGLTFHRVVPDFVVQAGDPRGDGWGGPGYAIRDEIGPLAYGRGVVGMALSGPDTGGSQFFVTLAPQPHLDGGYTAFGRVTRGMEVLDQIRQGERILRVREVEGSR